MLRSTRDALAGLPLVIVDDAHLLDPLSAALVYQLAVGGTRLLVTVAAGAGLPDAVAALLADELLHRIEVEPPGHDAARIAAQVDRFVGRLEPAARRVLGYLAVLDPMPVTALHALAGKDAVQRARGAGLVRIDGAAARCAHPLFAAAMADAVGGPELRRLRTEVVAALPSGDDVISRLRVAALALDSDFELTVPELTDAAAEALRLGDLGLSERLGAAAVRHGGGLAARLPLAYALGWQGRGRQAEAVLAEVDTEQLTESELMDWALPRAANQFWMLSEPERATAFLR
ncbi:hypothetical protein ACN269_34975, partial [Micromonospora sp. WMMD736]